jgi:hypothetical protein
LPIRHGDPADINVGSDPRLGAALDLQRPPDAPGLRIARDEVAQLILVHHPPPVGACRRPARRCRLRLQDDALDDRPAIEQVDAATAARREVLPIGAEREVHQQQSRRAQGQRVQSVGRVPQLDPVVQPGRGEALAARAPAEAPDAVVVPAQNAQLAAELAVVDLDLADAR